MNAYYEQKILNSEPMELIRLVYQRAISCVRKAGEHLREKRIEERSAAIMGAYAAIAQLICALRPEVAPELCGRLGGLYVYMQQRLLEANAQQTEVPLMEVLELLQTLEEAWAEAATKLAAGSTETREARGDSFGVIELRNAPSYAMSV